MRWTGPAIEIIISLALALLPAGGAPAAGAVLDEAEAFDDLGGRALDQQLMDSDRAIMHGSEQPPYIVLPELREG